MDQAFLRHVVNSLSPRGLPEKQNLQAPRFGNGRSINDLAKRVFTEIANRKVDNGRRGGDHRDARALAEDIRRAIKSALQQMTKAVEANGNAAVDVNNMAFSTGSERAPGAPTITTRTTTNASGEAVAKTHRTAEGRGVDHDPFLSIADLELLHEMCKIARIDVDSPNSVLQGSEDLRKALELSLAEGGAGFCRQEARAFMRKVASDRAGLDRLEQEAAETAARLASDEIKAETELADAEAELTKQEEQDGDEELLNKLMRAKRLKELALRKAREQRERELAVEKASQAALRRMGVCPAGFSWKRQGGGWRCAGGSHYVSGHDVSAAIKGAGGL